jgi:hypothetical protein
MTTTEHLQKIKSECESCLRIASIANSVYGRAEAGWRSTIAAIDCIEDMAEHIGNHQASLIIAAWPTELLS